MVTSTDEIQQSVSLDLVAEQTIELEGGRIQQHSLNDIEDEGDDMSVSDDMTEVQLEDNDILNQDLSRGNDGLPEDEAHSREILLHEIHRAQRANFLHFLLLCSIPIIFLVVVLSSINDSIDCSDDLVFCSRESRAFINAFSSRCMCDAIVIAHHDEYV